jgi:hypothetical protein
MQKAYVSYHFTHVIGRFSSPSALLVQVASLWQARFASVGATFESSERGNRSSNLLPE